MKNLAQLEMLSIDELSKKSKDELLEYWDCINELKIYTKKLEDKLCMAVIREKNKQ